MEFTSLRRIDRTWNVTFQNNCFLFFVHICRRNCRKQSFCIWMIWMFKQFFCCRKLHHIPQIHNANTVTDIFDNAQVMRNKQICQVVLLFQIQKQVDDLRLDGNVQSGYRFVTYNKLRIYCQRSGYTDTLSLSAGELMGVTMDKVRCKSALLHNLHNIILHLGIAFFEHSMGLKSLSDNLSQRHTGIQRRIWILENKLQIPAQIAHLFVCQRCQIDSVILLTLIFFKIRIGFICLTDLIDLNQFFLYCLLQSRNLRFQLRDFLQSFFIFLNFLNLRTDTTDFFCRLILCQIVFSCLCKVGSCINTADQSRDIQKLVQKFTFQLCDFLSLHFFLDFIRNALILCIELLNLSTHLFTFFLLIRKVFEDIFHIFQVKIFYGTSIIYSTSACLFIQLKKRTSESGFSTSGLSYQSKSLSFINIQRNTIVCFYKCLRFPQLLLSDWEILFQMGDPKQYFLFFTHYFLAPFSG